MILFTPNSQTLQNDKELYQVQFPRMRKEIKYFLESPESTVELFQMTFDKT